MTGRSGFEAKSRSPAPPSPASASTGSRGRSPAGRPPIGSLPCAWPARPGVRCARVRASISERARANSGPRRSYSARYSGSSLHTLCRSATLVTASPPRRGPAPIRFPVAACAGSSSRTPARPPPAGPRRDVQRLMRLPPMPATNAREKSVQACLAVAVCRRRISGHGVYTPSPMGRTRPGRGAFPPSIGQDPNPRLPTGRL